MTSVASNILEIKKREVREDENRKAQSLKQFREWIDKHPFVKNLKIYDEFLLIFLRTYKYQMDRVFNSFEKYFLFTKKRSDWYDWRGEKFQRMMDLYDSGYFKVLTQRDSKERKVLIINANKFDTEKFTADDAFRLGSLITFICCMDEEVQLCGLVLIFNAIDVNLKFYTIFSLSAFYDIGMEFKTNPMRMKNISVIGLSSIATQLLNAFKMNLSEKIKNRLSILSGKDELWMNFDRKIFTQDIGGEVDEREVIDDFRRVIDAKIEIMREIMESCEIDMKMAGMKNVSENIGSFRKLEID